jgi:hypothetical protein
VETCRSALPTCGQEFLGTSGGNGWSMKAT